MQTLPQRGYEVGREMGEQTGEQKGSSGRWT